MSAARLEQTVDLLADLRPNFASRLRDRAALLSTFVDEIKQGTIAGDAIPENHRCVHSIISSAAIFGHMELSRVARQAEMVFEQLEMEGTGRLLDAIESVLTTAHAVLHVYEKPKSRG